MKRKAMKTMKAMKVKEDGEEAAPKVMKGKKGKCASKDDDLDKLVAEIENYGKKEFGLGESEEEQESSDEPPKKVTHIQRDRACVNIQCHLISNIFNNPSQRGTDICKHIMSFHLE